MKKNLEEISISPSCSIRDALLRMDDIGCKLLLVLKDGLFFSLLSIGDIQRAIIANYSLDSEVKLILRPKVNVATTKDLRSQVIAHMKEFRNEFMPIVDDHGKVTEVIFWEDLFKGAAVPVLHSFNLPVVIMAGGQGTRLRPLTNVLPKPLIPIGEQTMLEDIMDRFVACGCHSFYISVNYKADIIKRYLDNLGKSQYHIEYFQEDKPLGTAGSLNLLKDKINSTFFVSNCDIIIDQDYSEILDFHKKNHNEITVIAALTNYTIPYGTLESGKEGQLTAITEKPVLTYKINTGMYILEPHLIEEIPSDRLYHITYLIEKLIKENRRVGVFPINEGSWTDIGNWDEYFKYIKGDLR